MGPLFIIKIKLSTKQSGQTSVEYLLMLAVVVMLVLSVSAKIKKYLSDDKECTASSKSMQCRLITLYKDSGFDMDDSPGNRFRYFKLR